MVRPITTHLDLKRVPKSITKFNFIKLLQLKTGFLRNLKRNPISVY